MFLLSGCRPYVWNSVQFLVNQQRRVFSLGLHSSGYSFFSCTALRRTSVGPPSLPRSPAFVLIPSEPGLPLFSSDASAPPFLGFASITRNLFLIPVGNKHGRFVRDLFPFLLRPHPPLFSRKLLGFLSCRPERLHHHVPVCEARNRNFRFPPLQRPSTRDSFSSS